MGEGPGPGRPRPAPGDRRGRPDAPDQILARWTWRLARAVRKVLDRKAAAEYPEAKRLLGALANSRGQRHEENAAKLCNAAKELPIGTAAALLASAEGYTPRANQHLDGGARGARHHPGGRNRPRRRPARAESARAARRRRRRKKKPNASARTARPRTGTETQTPAKRNREPGTMPADVTTEQAAKTE